MVHQNTKIQIPSLKTLNPSQSYVSELLPVGTNLKQHQQSDVTSFALIFGGFVLLSTTVVYVI